MTALPATVQIVVVTGLSGAGRSTAAKCLEDLGWFVVDNLPPGLLTTMAELGGLLRRCGVADRRGRRRAQPGVLLRPADGPAGPRGAGRPAAGAVPRGQRRGAGPPVRERPPAAPAAGRRSARRRHQARARAAARPARRGRPGRRHHRPQRPRAAGPDRRGVQRRPRGSAAGDRRVVRLQVRPAGRRRPGRRLPVPAQPALGPDLRPRTGQDPLVRDYVLSQPRRARVPRPLQRGAGRPDARATGPRASATSSLAVGCTGGKHRSVAMAEQLAAAARPTSASTSRSATATWVASERPGRGPRPQGGRPRWRPRPGGDPDRAAAASPTSSPRSSPSPTTAGRAAGCATSTPTCCRRVTCAWRWSRWPATTPTAGCGARSCSTASPATATLGRPRRRQPADDRLARRAGRSGARARRAGPAGRQLRPGAADVHDAARDRRRGRRPDAPTRVAYRPRSGSGSPSPPVWSGWPSSRADPPACSDALTAVHAADLVVLGPGSWFTSVLPHLLVPELAAALHATTARRVLVLNIAAEAGETADFSPQEHLEVLLELRARSAASTWCWPTRALPATRADLPAARVHLGAELVLAPVAVDDGSPRHDPVRLASAFREVLAARHGPAGRRPATSSNRSGTHIGSTGGHRAWR